MLTDSASERAFSKPYVYVWPAIVSRTSDHDHANDNVHVNRIPKELFDMACDELMPVRKDIYKLVVKTSKKHDLYLRDFLIHNVDERFSCWDFCYDHQHLP